eukprot:TRINITY_DN35106_c0_g1_i1.p1 TRINITY_DN35106_c0_g1~~TRINITY_DN35106_c0_g1_i1.p1  ORF type:complete len:100 (+),score=21.25 TRINITY_DN35106_c0_g1_i1:89-388(+)
MMMTTLNQRMKMKMRIVLFLNNISKKCLRRKREQKEKEIQYGNKKSKSSISCFYCKGFRHMVVDCANTKEEEKSKSKAREKKVIEVNWDDEASLDLDVL